MAGQVLNTWIKINAMVGNGFSKVGTTLTELGYMVDGISQKLINFGKESVEVYENYEKSMTEAEVALSTKYGRGTKELANAMDQLDAKATEWAATTIFHTDDVADAINQAAHAGWDLDEILNGIPVAMQLAQAGSMDLSEALTYITKTMKAFDVPYEELGEFIDMWVFAANSSTGDVKDFGDAMKKMGATMRFTDSKEELFALIGLMHDMGESGSTAATLLRTSMMRILAPSGVASKVMEQLGATDEEINEIREDASKLAALDMLAGYGFSAFDDKGQAKPILQIYAELGEVLAQIAGGYENITKNETTLGVLSTIFGNRGITGALDIVTALQRAVVLRDKLLQGDATGYGEYAAGTMMDTLYGKMETFESKVERLKQVVGEELAGQLESVMENVGGIVDSIAGMDEGKFSALVSGLEVIAAAGPALLGAGIAFRYLGFLFSPLGGLTLGAIAITAAATAVQKLQEADLKDTFGNMEMDTEHIASYIHSLGEDFRTAYEFTDKFQTALGEAVTKYTEASGTFGTNLFSAMIENTKLSPTDFQNLIALGDQMYEYAQQAIYSAASGDTEYWRMLFGGDEAVNNPNYRAIIEKFEEAYKEDEEELKQIGIDMRAAITAAWDDDQQISEDEYNKILDYFRRYNEMVAKAAAQAQEEENRVTMQKWLLQAQTGSFDDINALSRQAAAERNELYQKEEDMFLDKKARLIEKGGTPEEIGQAEALHKERLNEINTRFDEFQLTLWDSQMSNNEQRDNWAYMWDIADAFLNGTLDTSRSLEAVTDKLGKSIYSGDGNILDNGNARSQMAKITGYMVSALGGEEAIQEKIDYYTKQGNSEMADRLKHLYAIEQLANGFYSISRTDPISLFGLNIDMFGDYATNAAVGGLVSNSNKTRFERQYVYGKNPAYVAAMEAYGGYAAQQEIEQLQKDLRQYNEEIYNHEKWLNGEDRPFLWNEGATNDALYGRGSDEGLYAKREKAEEELAEARKQLEAATEAANAAMEQVPLSTLPEGAFENPIQIQPMQTGEGAAHNAEQLAEQGVNVTYTGNTTQLDAVIDGEDGQTLTEYITGDPSSLHATIMNEEGQVLEQIVTGDTSALAAEIQKFSGTPIRVKIFGDRLFAEGGRATQASVFGEAGPEWAIPEQHSDRTAQLLNEARAASGFTWPELLERFGGLNANTTPQNTTIVYSPTINARDADGVERVLQDDRQRFEKWYEDKKMRDEAEVYA